MELLQQLADSCRVDDKTKDEPIDVPGALREQRLDLQRCQIARGIATEGEGGGVGGGGGGVV
eukprot:766244-Hanusia_phi.AAC.5